MNSTGEAAAVTQEASVTTKNISMVFILRAAQYPFLLLYLLLVPRMMGPDTYGQYALLISIIAIVTSVIDLGVTDVIARFIPEFEVGGESRKIRKFSSNILALKAIVDVLTSVVLFAVLYFAYGDRYSSAYFIVIIAVMLVSDIGTIPYALVFGMNDLGKYSLRDPIRRAIGIVFVLVFFHYFGLIGAILSTLLVESLLSALYFFWTRDHFSAQEFKIDLRFLSPYLRFGFISYISWTLLNIWQRLGNSLIEYISKNPSEVALFDMPNQILLATISFTLFLIISLIPIFTKLLLTGKEGKIITWSSLIMRYIGILCILIFGSFLLVGQDLIPLVIGPKFTGIFPNAVVLLLSTFPMTLGQLGFVYSIVYKEPGRYVLALGIAFLAFLAASVLLIPTYASMGCSIATLVSSIVLAIAVGVYYRRKMAAVLIEGLKVIALGLVFAPFLLIHGGLVAELGITAGAVLCYTALLFLARVVKISELQEILAAIRHRPTAL